jgi:hypothetical protein
VTLCSLSFLTTDLHWSWSVGNWSLKLEPIRALSIKWRIANQRWCSRWDSQFLASDCPTSRSHWDLNMKSNEKRCIESFNKGKAQSIKFIAEFKPLPHKPLNWKHLSVSLYNFRQEQREWQEWKVLFDTAWCDMSNSVHMKLISSSLIIKTSNYVALNKW